MAGEALRADAVLAKVDLAAEIERGTSRHLLMCYAGLGAAMEMLWREEP